MKTFALRKHVRFKTEMPVMIRQSGKFTWFKGAMLNLSRGGLMVHSEETLDLSSKLELEFNTVDRQGARQRRRLFGEVRWRRGFKYGVKFLKKQRTDQADFLV